MTKTTLERRPVARAGLMAGTVGAVVNALVVDLAELAVTLGMDPDVTAVLQRILLAVVALAVALGIVRWSEILVTPVADPRDDDGDPLVSVASAAEAAAVERIQAVLDRPPPPSPPPSPGVS